MHKKYDWPPSQHKGERPGIIVVKEIIPANKGSESRNMNDQIREDVPVLCTLWIKGNDGVLQRFRGSAVVLGLNSIVSPSEQSEAITTHQIVTSVLICPFEKHWKPRTYSVSFELHSADNPLKSVFPLDEISGHLYINTFNTFGVAELLVPGYHRFHRWLFVFKSFGLGTTLKDIATTWLF